LYRNAVNFMKFETISNSYNRSDKASGPQRTSASILPVCRNTLPDMSSLIH